MKLYIPQPPQPVELSDEQMRLVAIAQLRRMLGGDGIEEGRVYIWEDTGHGSGLTTHLRDATMRDYVIAEVLAALNQVRD